jgi:hypothetical protein
MAGPFIAQRAGNARAATLIGRVKQVANLRQRERWITLAAALHLLRFSD